jgi:hypothetical protein
MRVGICSIQRNRGAWIREWILFHHLLGVRYFYIGIHKTHDDTIEVLNLLSNQINIKLFAVSDTTYRSPQQDFYQFTLDRYRHEVDWMAFIDQDEFIFPTKAETLQAALQHFTYKNFSALGVYWKCFGSGGHIEEPKGFILENFKYRAPDDFLPNRHVKSVVHTAMDHGAIRVSCVHRFDTSLGTFDELGRFITGGFSDLEPSYEHLRINHYVCQSREHFLSVKRPQGDGNRNSVKEEDLRSEGWWEHHNRNDIKCEAIDRFIPKLKKLDQAFLEGKVEGARAVDIRMPLSRRIRLLKEMIFNSHGDKKLRRSRLLGAGVRRFNN